MRPAIVACVFLAGCSPSKTKAELVGACHLRAIERFGNEDPSSAYYDQGPYIEACMQANGYQWSLGRAGPQCQQGLGMFFDAKCYVRS